MMGKIMILCPKTGKYVWTGFNAEEEAFRGSKFDNLSVPCPHCGAVHPWSTGDARLVSRMEESGGREGPPDAS